MSDTMTIAAPAKVNLALSVGQADDDGMHPICSWMVTVSLADELLLTRLAPGSISRFAIRWHEEALRRTEIDWPVRRDLAVRAHGALESRLRTALPVQMLLDKRIPVGAGLGGGSADAAAMLHGLNMLFGLGLADDELAACGAELGSDVPFLVRGGSGIVEGLGDRIEHHEALPELHAVLAVPEASCATGEVYRTFDEHPGPGLRDQQVRQLAGEGARGMLFNDLAEPAIRLAPEIGEARDQLGALADRPAHVTGSGSCVFVVCDDALHAEALARTAREQLGLVATGVAARPGR